MTSRVKCNGCGKLIQEDVNFCPNCGMSLERLEQEYIYETMNMYTSISKQKLDEFLELMKNPEELEERVSEKESKIFEKQREITKRILVRFPELKRYLVENPEIEFKAFIISIPYNTDKGILQHDCLLQKLAQDQKGLVNFSLGSTQLATDLFAFDVPVWAPRKIGNELLHFQKQQIERCLPDSQRKFLYCAEPWWVCTRVFDLDGRWVNWRLLFKTEDIIGYTKDKGEVPLNFHLFSNMEHSNLFSIAGTHGDGEVLVGLYRKKEEKIFKEQVEKLNELYDFGKKPQIETIKIAWDTLEHLGLIGFSAQQLLRSERSHFFRKTISEKIIENTEQETVSETKGAMTGGKLLSKDKFAEKQVRKFLWYGAGDAQEGAVKITQGIPRKLRKDFRVLGDKA